MQHILNIPTGFYKRNVSISGNTEHQSSTCMAHRASFQLLNMTVYCLILYSTAGVALKIGPYSQEAVLSWQAHKIPVALVQPQQCTWGLLLDSVYQPCWVKNRAEKSRSLTHRQDVNFRLNCSRPLFPPLPWTCSFACIYPNQSKPKG